MMTRIARVDDALDVVDAPVPDGLDLQRVDGPMGAALRGGRLTTAGYRDGRPVNVGYTLDADVAVPLEEDGLVLWSFYAHLHEAYHEFVDRGIPVEPIAPLDAFAWSPASAMDFSAAENAAYAPTAHIFVLFPEVLDGLPLAANDGVVRHELGHTVFQWLTVGALRDLGPAALLDTNATLETRAINEGFADTVATLSLDDPDFIELSLPMPSRDVRGDAVATDALYPSVSANDALGTLGYDPYALGTVLASLAWDLRELTGDPDAVLLATTDAAQAWAAHDRWGDFDAFASLLASGVIARFPEQRAAVCERLLTRVPRAADHEEASACSR